MKEKISRFIEAFNMNGEVKRKTIMYGSIAIAIIVLLIILLCMLPKKKPVEEPAPVPQETPVKEPEKVEEKKEEEIPRIEPEKYEEPAEMEEILKKYENAYAWIEIPGTSAVLSTPADVSYPIAQHPTERLYYLDKDLDGNTNKAGTLFTEKTVEGKEINGKDFNDPVTVIYGHNQANRTMFGGLQTYMSKMDFSKENIIYIYQKDRRITYQIIGGVQYDTSHLLYYHDFSDEEIYNEFFAQLKKETDPSTNIDTENWPKYGDKLLILSVCKNGDDNHRYFVIGKMIEDTADPETWKIDESKLTAEQAAQLAAEKKTAAK